MKKNNQFPRPIFRHFFHESYINQFDTLYKQLPYKSVELECYSGYGPFPRYKLRLFRDGTAEYEGSETVALKGSHRGTFSVLEFGKLAYLIDKLSIHKLKNTYTIPETDHPGTIAIISTADGGTKSIRDYGNNGPILI